MRKLILTVAAMAVAMPVAMTFPTDANAQYRGRADYRCKKTGGTTGAVVGGVGGAVVGSLLGGTAATLVGAGAGGLAGREVERSKKKSNCKKRYYRR